MLTGNGGTVLFSTANPELGSKKGTLQSKGNGVDHDGLYALKN